MTNHTPTEKSRGSTREQHRAADAGRANDEQDEAEPQRLETEDPDDSEEFDDEDTEEDDEDAEDDPTTTSS